MTVAVKYDMGPSMLKVLSDPADAIADFHALALRLQGEVTAIEDAAKSDTTEKENPLSAAYDKDEDGKASAIAFLRADDGPFASIIDYINDDAGRTYHVLNAVRDLLVKYLQTEADYFKMQMAPKNAAPNRKGEFKSDFNEVRDLIAHITGMAQHQGFDPTSCEFLTTSDGGKTYKSILTGYRGAKASDDGTVTGRYAKVYGLAWNIDDEPIEDGWAISDIVRIIWIGPDRIGKNAKSLTDILDSETDWDKTDWTASTFEINGHTITVSRTITED